MELFDLNVDLQCYQRCGFVIGLANWSDICVFMFHQQVCISTQIGSLISFDLVDLSRSISSK